MIASREAAWNASSELEAQLQKMITELEKSELELRPGEPRSFSRGKQNGLRDAQSAVRVFFDHLANTLPFEKNA